jgi:hypothetical protein
VTDGNEGLFRRQYEVLLALLLVSLALESVNASGGARYLSDAFRMLLGIAIWSVVFRFDRARVATAALVVLASALNLGRYLAPHSLHHALSLAEQATLALFLWWAVWEILRHVFQTQTVGSGNVLGAVCGYIIAGSAWARVNAVAYLLLPSAYSINPQIAALLPDWHGRVALFTYYAFSQMLTIGYADVTPVSAPATTLSLFAALFGVFYTAVVISQFVGLARSAKGGGSGQ